MRLKALLILVISIITPPAFAQFNNVAESDVAELQELRQKVIDAKSPIASGKAYKKLFLRLGQNGLNDLFDDTNTGIALQAAWHHKLVVAPRWGKEPQSGYGPGLLKSNDAQRFFGFLEGRTGLEIPDWWQTEGDFPNLQIETEHERKLGPDIGPGLKLEGSLHLPHYFEIEQIDRGLQLVAFKGRGEHERAFVLRQETFAEGLKIAGSRITSDCHVQVDKDQTVLSFANAFGDPSPLLCFDSKSGELRWAKKVWALGNMIGGATGQWPSRLQMNVTDKNVVVWGAGVFGRYVESFNKKTGKPSFRFSTNYWHQW